MTMLAAHSIEKRYPTPADDLVVLRNVTLEVPAGGAAVIMGPSGSGKSTFLNILGALDAPTGGRLVIDGQDVLRLQGRALARFRNAKVGFVFQEHFLLPQCSALENVLIPTLIAKDGTDRLDRARALLERVGLSDRSSHRPAELSGGERQRVAIARALINRPALVLADEPTGNLDQATADRVSELLVDLNRAEKTALVVVTHSAALAQRVGNVHELRDGELVAT